MKSIFRKIIHYFQGSIKFPLECIKIKPIKMKIEQPDSLLSYYLIEHYFQATKQNFITPSCCFLSHIKFVCQNVRETNDDKNKHDYSSAKLQQRKVPLTKQMHFHSVTFAKLKFRIASANIRTNFYIYICKPYGRVVLATKKWSLPNALKSACINL